MINDRVKVHFEVNLEELIEYFQSLDQEYLTQLLKEVNLNEYAEKLVERANKIILRDGSKIVASLFYYENQERIFISHLSVCKSAERQGLGKKVLELLRSNVTDRAITLEVDTNNSKAQKFYEIMGFKEVLKTPEKLVLELSWN